MIGAEEDDVSFSNVPTFLNVEKGQLKSKLNKKIEIEGIGVLDLELVVYDSTFIFEVILKNRSHRFQLRISSESLQDSPNSLLKFSPKTLYKAFKEMFFGDDKSRMFEYSFYPLPLSSENTNIVSKSSFISSSSSKKRRRILKDGDDGTILVLHMKCTPHPVFFYNHCDLYFRFNDLPFVDIDPLPNELFVVIFGFLDPFYLQKKVSFVCQRFRVIIQSEYMYRTYCKPLFIDHKKKKGSETWKLFVHTEWKNRIQWNLKGPKEFAQLQWPDSFQRVFGEENMKGMWFNESRRIFRLENDRGVRSLLKSNYRKTRDYRYFSVLTNRYVSPQDSCRWTVRIKKSFNDSTTWLKYWVGIYEKGFDDWSKRKEGSLYDGVDGLRSVLFCPVSGSLLRNGGVTRVKWGPGVRRWNPLPIVEQRNAEIVVKITLNNGVVTFEDGNGTNKFEIKLYFPEKSECCLGVSLQSVANEEEFELISFEKLE